MDQSELLRRLCNHLSRTGIRYFITGSQATIVYGEPRFTNDIDVVIDLDEANCQAFFDGFPADEYYLNRETARQEVCRRGMFNIIHPTSGLKIDVVIPSGSSLDQQRFERRVPITLGEDYTAFFSSPEDIILKKLQWHRLGGGERHLRDIQGILRVSGAKLDRAYIDQHVGELLVKELWQQIQQPEPPGRQ